MSPELWFHSSKGEAFPHIGESQRWNTAAPRDVCNVANLLQHTWYLVYHERSAQWRRDPGALSLKNFENAVLMCSERVRRVMLQYLGALLISGAYAFWTCCDFRIKHCGLSGWLPRSSRLVVNTYTNVSIHSQCNLQIQFKFVKLWRISLLSFPLE